MDAPIVFPKAINFVSAILLVITTWHSKHLRSACQLLIAFDALCHVVVGYQIVLSTVNEALWGPQQSLAHCYAVTVFWYLAYETASVMPLIIALERALNVFCPIWVKSRGSEYRVAGMMAFIALLFGTVSTLFYGAQIVLLGAEQRPVPCNGIDIYATDVGASVAYKNASIVIGCWAIYAAIWLRLRQRARVMAGATTSHLGATGTGGGGDSSSDQLTKKISRTLTVIVALLSACWLTPTLLAAALNVLHSPMDVYIAVCSYSALYSINLFNALTLLSLYCFASEYRKAVNELLAKFLCFKCCRKVFVGAQSTTTVVVIAPPHRNQQHRMEGIALTSVVVHRYKMRRVHGVGPLTPDIIPIA